MGGNERQEERIIPIGDAFLAIVFLIGFLGLFLFLNSFLVYLLEFLSFEHGFVKRIFLYTSILTQVFLMLGLVYFFGARRVGWKAFGLSSFNLGKALLWGGGSYLLFFLFELSVNFVFVKVFNKPFPSQNIKLLFGDGWVGFLFALIVAGVFGPVVEEIFFRGFFYGTLRKYWGTSRAILVSAFIFSLFHLNPFILPLIFLLGIILAFLYEKRGSLDASICLHILNNVLAIVFVYSNLLGRLLK